MALVLLLARPLALTTQNLIAKQIFGPFIANHSAANHC
jgi:hypothetical protein